MAPLLLQCREQLLARLPDGDHAAAQADHLIAGHGLRAPEVLSCAASEREQVPLSAVIPLCVAEIRHAVRHEHARSPVDVLARRCRLAMVDGDEARRLEPTVRSVLAEEGRAAGDGPCDWQTLAP
jgi:glycerol-3-phosphate dehydrogenase